jgi:hypothetical protein
MEIELTRIDIHRPSAIRPADYRFVGMLYAPRSNELDPLDLYAVASERKRVQQDIERTGGRYAQHTHGGSCHVCGAWAATLAVFHHAATNEYIQVGETCADKIDGGDEAVFRVFRAALKAEREAAAGKRKAQAALANAGLSAAWAIFSATDASAHRWEENTITDVVGKLVRYGSISDKQTAFIGSLLAKIDGRAAIDAQRAVEKAASQHVGAVGERRTFTLTVKAVPSFDTAYGTMYVHICRDEAGNTVIYKGKEIAEKGQKITLKATVKDHGERDGEKQTIISRPADVRVEGDAKVDDASNV